MISGIIVTKGSKRINELGGDPFSLFSHPNQNGHFENNST
jgi:hypothetical protein